MKFELKDLTKADLLRTYLADSKIDYEEKKATVRKRMTPEEKKAKRDARTPEQLQKIAERVKKMQDARKLKRESNKSSLPSLPNVEKKESLVVDKPKAVRKPRKQAVKNLLIKS